MVVIDVINNINQDGIQSFQIYGFSLPEKAGSMLNVDKCQIYNYERGRHPIDTGSVIYGVAACLAYLRLIFAFEIHHRFGPILYCIKNIFWDILSGNCTNAFTSLLQSIVNASIKCNTNV